MFRAITARPPKHLARKDNRVIIRMSKRVVFPSEVPTYALGGAILTTRAPRRFRLGLFLRCCLRSA